MTHEQDLRHLANLYRIETSYYDISGRMHEASPDALLAVLRAMDAPLQRPEEAYEAVRAVVQQRWQRPLPPVTVCWEDRPAEVLLRLADADAPENIRCELALEEGGIQTWECRPANMPVVLTEQVEGCLYRQWRLELPGPLPRGYHRLMLLFGGRRAETFIIAAPEKSYQGEGPRRRDWGVFLPLYALRRDGCPRRGDLSDFERLLHWAGEQGAAYAATLPILAGDLSEDPSPYAPNSLCWWNEFYLDLTRLPEFSRATAAATLMEEHLRRLPPADNVAGRVDYAGDSRLQREVLDVLARAFFADPAEREESLERFCLRHPDVRTYARFRAAQEAHGTDWRYWPPELRDDLTAETDLNEPAYRRHLYAQWNLEEQIEQIAARAAAKGMAWYVDMPLGSARTGYDVWRHRALFATETSGGAPPDAFFSKGQDWGFPPLRPDRLRENRYGYFIEVLRRQMQHASLLRLDHAMRFERLFWVPAGMHAREGVYVHYPADEFFAILTLESQRTRTRLVGENLGTVTESLNERLLRHGIDGIYVLQFAVHANPERPVSPVPATAAAQLNTHDTFPFAAFLAGFDVDDRLDLGLLDEGQAMDERHYRQRVRHCLVGWLHREGLLSEWTLDPELVLEALMRYLAASPAHSVTVNLEDLWLETRPQNMPGTFTERPNWRRRAKCTLEDFARHPTVGRILRAVEGERRKELEGR